MLITERMFSIKKASKILGIHRITLHRWHKASKISCFFTLGGHRRFPESELERILKNKSESTEPPKKEMKVVLYARVASQKQKDAGNLQRQMDRLIEYAHKNNYTIIKALKEVGSGLNENRSKLKHLFKSIMNDSVDKIIVEYKDRLTRFGFKYIETLARLTNTEIEIIENRGDKEPMQELVEDMLALISSFAARLYGRRIHRKSA